MRIALAAVAALAAVVACIAAAAACARTSSSSPESGEAISCGPSKYISNGGCVDFPGFSDAISPAGDDRVDGDVAVEQSDATLGIEGDVIDNKLDVAPLYCGDVQAVPVCVAYQELLAKCLSRDFAFACQSSLLPTEDADVAAIEQICQVNLQRLQQSCR